MICFYFPFFFVEAICIFHYTNYTTRREEEGKHFPYFLLFFLLPARRLVYDIILQVQLITRPKDLPRPSRLDGKDRSWCHEWEYFPSARYAPLPAGWYPAPAGFPAHGACRS